MKGIFYQLKRAESTQQSFCPTQEQKSFYLQIDGAQEWLAALEIQGLDDNQLPEEEQYRLHEHFQQVLVSLPHPFQMLLRIAPMRHSTPIVQFTDDRTTHQKLLVRRVNLIIPALA